MTGHLSALGEVVRAVRITAPASYSWFCRPAFRIPRSHAAQLSAEAATVHLASALTRQLYRDFYTCGRAVAARADRPASRPSDTSAAADLLARLRLPEHAWQPGWTVQAVAPGRVAVTRGDLTLWVADNHCAVDRGDPQPGRPAAVLLPTASCAISPGYLVVYGRRLPEPESAASAVRVYWNLSPSAAAPFLRGVARELNGAAIGHVAKVLVDTDRPDRRDTGVLLLSAADFAPAAPLLASVVHRLHDDLRPGTPAFTCEIARGVGIAESHWDGGSYGLARCTALAESILEAHAAAPGAPENERFDAVVGHLAARGVRPDVPHLQPGSSAEYTLPARTRTRERRSPRPDRAGMPAGLPIAAMLAERLCADAVWDGAACGWLGVRTQAAAGSRARPAFGALGPDLYEGAGGIALFLAEAARLLDDERALRTAVGAVRGALVANRATAEAGVGVYCGPVGVALAAARVGRYFDLPELLDEARLLAKGSVARAEQCSSPDLVGGRAGQVVGLLAVAGLLDDQQLVAWAARTGELLLADARGHSTGALSWPSSVGWRRRGLTGLAHGAAGIGYAFTELYAATGDDHHRDAASRAFDYERSWFSVAQGNWPDLRLPSRRKDPDPSGQRYEWCHGAAGIALSRLRAHEVLGEQILLDEARVGLSTTAHAVRTVVADRADDDHSLCQGLSGQADVLLSGAAVEHGSDAEQAMAAVAGRASTLAGGRQGWPCGVPTGEEVPGLMLGLAGIGYFHLRLHDPDGVPSVLLPTAHAATR